MSSDLERVPHAGIEDEVGELAEHLGPWSVNFVRAFGGTEFGDEGLDHVVAMHVGAQLERLGLQDLYYLPQLFLHQAFFHDDFVRLFNNCLHRTCSVLVQREVCGEGQ